MNRFFRTAAPFLLAVPAIAPVLVNGLPPSPAANSCGFIGNTPASTVKPAGVTIPPAIGVTPAEGVFYLKLYAKGTQNYRCDAGVGWTLVEPRALLFNSNQCKYPIGKHYFLDPPDSNGGKAVWAGSDVQSCGAVVTKKIAQADSPNPAKNIPWLKTATTSTMGRAGGVLSKATFVQRVLTDGGQPPAAQECGQKFSNGQMFESPYTTEYWFYRRP